MWECQCGGSRNWGTSGSGRDPAGERCGRGVLSRGRKVKLSRGKSSGKVRYSISLVLSLLLSWVNIGGLAMG